MHPQRPSPPRHTSIAMLLAVIAVIALSLSLVGHAPGAVAADSIVLDNARYLRWSADDATSPYITRTFEGLTIAIDAHGQLSASSSSSGVDEVWPMDSPTALFTFASELTMAGTHDDQTGELHGTFDFSGNVSSSTTFEREGKEPLTMQSRSSVTYAGTFFRQTSKETDATIIEFRGVHTSVGETQNVNLEWEPHAGTADRTYRVAFDPLLPTTVAADPNTSDTDELADASRNSAPPISADNDAATTRNATDGSAADGDGEASLPSNAAVIAALAVVAALLAALGIGLNARRKPSTTSSKPTADPNSEDDEEEEEEEPTNITLSLTHPAGQSPNVFTSGWVFGARAISDPGGPSEQDISDRVIWNGSGSFRPNTGNRSRPVFAGTGPNEIVLSVEADGKSVTRSFTVTAVSPGGFAHVGSRALCAADSHGCPACPHEVVGAVQTGSTVVTVDGKPAARVGDSGRHATCCGPNTFTIASGDSSVLIDGRPAARLGSATTHCGGTGQLTA